MSTGVGVWGNNHPVMWGWDIVNFVWWVGVAHAGTLISALLFLTQAALAHDHRPHGGSHDRFLRDDGRSCIRPFTSVAPGLTGSCFPIPNSNGLWPQFRSPLMWDVFAVNTYLIVSTLFWFMGMIPDFAVLRDRSKTRVRKAIFSCSGDGLDRFGPALA